MTITVNLNGWILILFSVLLAGDAALNIIYLFLKLKEKRIRMYLMSGGPEQGRQRREKRPRIRRLIRGILHGDFAEMYKNTGYIQC